MEKINVIIDWENNYGAYSPELSGCIATGQTLAEVKTRMKEAIEWHFEAMQKDGETIPEKYEIEFHLNVRALMQKYKGIITHAGLERLTGINKRQIEHYASGRRKPMLAQRKKIERALHDFGKELTEVEL